MACLAPGNGTLSKEELDSVLAMCISESSLRIHEELVEELSNVVWGTITGWSSDRVSFEEFYNTLCNYPAVYDNLNVK